MIDPPFKRRGHFGAEASLAQRCALAVELQAVEPGLRNAAQRKRRWLSRKWKVSAKGNAYLNTDGLNITVYQKNPRLYLRAMYNRFGSPGFLAAYNAGPGRYAEHLSTGRPLPRETRAYVARLAPLIERPDAGRMQDNGPPTITDWRVAPLFIEQFGDAATTASPPNQETVGTPSESTSRADDEGPARPPNALFIGPQAEVSP